MSFYGVLEYNQASRVPEELHGPAWNLQEAEAIRDALAAETESRGRGETYEIVVLTPLEDDEEDE